MSRSLALSCKQPPVLLPYADFGESAGVLTAPLLFHTIHVAITILEKTGDPDDFYLTMGSGGFGTVSSEAFLDPAAENYWEWNQEMWRGYEWHLCMYTMTMIQLARKTPLGRGPICELGKGELEFHVVTQQDRGVRETWLKNAMIFTQKEFSSHPRTNLPYWHNEALVHESHQSWMIRHDRAYKHHFPKTPDILPLVWPPCEEGKRRVL